jgi:ribosome biogenesis GTP-binding protein YsxC/EngB
VQKARDLPLHMQRMKPVWPLYKHTPPVPPLVSQRAFDGRGTSVFDNQTATFLMGCALPEQLAAIDDAHAVVRGGEVAFIGRSNVGKSTLLNTLLGVRGHGHNIAKTSSKPGKTRELNYFGIDNRFAVVDLPGYGFAKAPRKQVDAWNVLLGDFVRQRRGAGTLQRMFILVDARRGLQRLDRAFALLLEDEGVPWQVVVTKVDKTRGPRVYNVVKGVARFVDGIALGTATADSDDGDTPALSTDTSDVVDDGDDNVDDAVDEDVDDSVDDGDDDDEIETRPQPVFTQSSRPGAAGVGHHCVPWVLAVSCVKRRGKCVGIQQMQGAILQAISEKDAGARPGQAKHNPRA